MADQRITELTVLPKAGIGSDDVLPIVDLSASETKKVTVKDLVAAGVDLVNDGEIDLGKLDQDSEAKLGTAALADGAVTAIKLAHDSSVVVDSAPPDADNFEGRGYFDSSTGNLQIFDGSEFQQVVMPTAGIGDEQVTTEKLADGSITTEKVSALGTEAYADGSVTAEKIADEAVTGDKIATETITAAKIAPGEIKDFLLALNSVNTTAVVDGAVTRVKLSPGAVGNQQLGLAAITNEKIADATIGFEKLNLEDNSIPGSKIINGSITSGKYDTESIATAAYANNSITTVKLADEAVTAAKIAPEAITANQIADGAIGNTELAESAVTYDKIQPASTGDVVLGRIAGSGPIEEITVTAAGRALLDDVDAAEQRETLGLGNIALASGTWDDGSSFSGISSGTNTGDQTIALTGDVTGSGTGAFATVISDGAITNPRLATNAVSSDKIADDAITGSKLGDNSAAIVQATLPTGAGEFVGQQWLNTNDALEYTWTGTEWLRQAGLGTINIEEATPLAFAVVYPDPYTANLSVTLDTQGAATVFAGPLSGDDAAPAFRLLEPSDLPNATAATKGIVQPGTGLAVTDGVLDHVNVVEGATVSGITFDAQGHITAVIPLVPSDIPELDAAKVTSGTLAADRIADGAITANKLANYATAQIGETLPQATFIGEIFFNPLDKAFFLWDGNVWQPIGISAGAIVFAGTYDAAVNQVASVTTEGAAIGLSVGESLPAASNTNANYYLVVSIGGTGTLPAPTVALAPPDLLLSNGSSWIEIDVSSTYTAQAASNVSFSPAGQVGSTNVQAAIEEVSGECRNANNITGGILAVERGGTGTGSYTKGDLLAASGATALAKLGVGTNGQVLSADSTETAGLKWVTPTVGTVTSVTSSTAALTVASGTTTPALTIRAATTAVNGIVQLSDSVTTTSSTLAATPTAVKSAYDLANAALARSGGTVTGQLLIGNAGSLVFDGATADANRTTLAVADPTANRTITLPNLTGTVALTSNLNDGTY